MKKEIAIFANRHAYTHHLKKNLEVYFSDVAVFNCYDMQELENMSKIQEKYVVLSAFTIYRKVKEKAPEKTKLLVIELTIKRAVLESLKKLPEGTRALVVSIDYKNCTEVITTIYNNGLRGLELIPCYPGCDFDTERDGDVNLAITMGEPELVPDFITSVLDYGERSIDIASVYAMAEVLGIDDPLSSAAAKKEAAELISLNTENARLLNEKKQLMSRLNSIVRIVAKGVIITDIAGRIFMINDIALSMLGIDEAAEGFNVTEILPQKYFRSGWLGDKDTVHIEEMVRIENRDIMITRDSVEENGVIGGIILTMEYFNDGEDRQHKFRRKLNSNGHRAVYTFEQIQGISPQLCECKEIACRLARTDSSICINGESGTGKELFAQSIHNESARSGYSFVAINCSALPESLLESELYGYEDGAFSGAVRGGKIGLFELAHRGTLFLDEIGEISLPVQAKLLRAIEEKKILRVGGRKLIDVDVRIISATNRDLRKMVREGTFREDLFYRICVLPISIPPLRERDGDVNYLFCEMCKSIGALFSLDQVTKEYLEQYRWPGNVREMRNLVEYLNSLGRECITLEDLPTSMREPSQTVEPEICLNPKTSSERQLEKFVLEKLAEAYRQGHRIGRGTLVKYAHNRDIFVSEQDVRKCLEQLNAKGFVVSGTGRSGSMLTKKGWEALRGMIEKTGKITG